MRQWTRARSRCRPKARRSSSARSTSVRCRPPASSGRAERFAMGYRCVSCGQWHDARPTAFKFPLPDVVAALDDDQRTRRVELGEEQCILDDTRFFILGNLDLPVIGVSDVIRWTIWSTLSQADFERASDLWTT